MPKEQGLASALNDVTREFGSALGVALLGAVLSAGYKISIDSRLYVLARGPQRTSVVGDRAERDSVVPDLVTG